ncbi:MAG: fibronectin type III domain-containing protein [Dehalogenimonas sp.]|uniref:Fibronectin type III domain-containing protein n=1 Tax=Candidatus Dehalogenimonas loeffleri TaxID=3127115 RepID=A0ABZ2J2U7_9CHLR|nr:fibronectin type III domain-containing protein [Dehalogenimonas sp.]
MKTTSFTRLAASLLLSLTFLLIPNPHPSAAADARWSEIPLPRTEAAGGWALAPGTDVTHLTTDQYGRLYAWVTGDGGGLFRTNTSDDKFTRVYASINIPVALNITAEGHIYYATETAVFRSIDDGGTFQQIASQPGGPDKQVTGMSIYRRAQGNLIAVSVTDTAPGMSGGVYLYDETAFSGSWIDTGIGSYDALDVSFSPTFETDRTLLALATDGNDTFIMVFNAGIWGQTELKHDDTASVTAIAGNLVLPEDFALLNNAQFYVGIDSGDADKGGVWLGFYQAGPQLPVVFPIASNLNEDFTCMSVRGLSGSYSLTGGTASGNVYNSADGGINWQTAVRNPAGDSISALTDLGGTVYAASSGAGSGIYKSVDQGSTWLPTALIDQNGAGTLVKVLPSPNYASDQTLYVLGFNSGHTLWLTENAGLSWQMILDAGEYGISEVPQITITDSGSLYILAQTSGNGICLISDNKGTTFEVLDLPVPINNSSRLAVENTNQLIFSTDDGTLAQVWHRDAQFFTPVAAGDQRITALELSPAFTTDQTLVATADDGKVLISTNAGVTFTSLPDLPLSGEIRLVFDPDFSTSGKIYAANDSLDKGIHRFTIGGTDWDRLDSGLPADTLISGLAVTRDNIIYASSYTEISDTTGGLIRALSDDASWFLTRAGLPDGATLEGIAVIGRQIWTLDTTNQRIMTYTDTLAEPVQLTSPTAAAGGLGDFSSGAISGINLKWQSISGAGSYEWQVNDSTGMSSPLFEDTTTALTAKLNNLEPNTTYYWRVRAATPVPGPWSDKWSFTTALGGTFTVPELITPAPGAVDLGLRPIFQWRPVSDADTYDLMVATDSGFAGIIINQTAIAGNAWQSETSLEAGKTYYWKVRAVSTATNSAWSAVSGFAVAPPVAVPEPPQPTPTVTTTVPQGLEMAIPEWLGLTLAGMGGAIVLLLLVLAVTVRNRRVL